MEVRIQAGAALPQHSRRQQAAATGGQHHSTKNLPSNTSFPREPQFFRLWELATACTGCCPREGLEYLVRTSAAMDRAGFGEAFAIIVCG